jgi:hypothetical protein
MRAVGFTLFPATAKEPLEAIANYLEGATSNKGPKPSKSRERSALWRSLD